MKEIGEKLKSARESMNISIEEVAEDMEEVIRPLLQAEEVANIQNQEKTVAFGSLYFIGAIEAMLEENNK